MQENLTNRETTKSTFMVQSTSIQPRFSKEMPIIPNELLKEIIVKNINFGKTSQHQYKKVPFRDPACHKGRLPPVIYFPAVTTIHEVHPMAITIIPEHLGSLPLIQAIKQKFKK